MPSGALSGLDGVLGMREDGIEEVEYEETEAYRVTHDFLQNPARSLRTLLSDDD